MKFGIVLAGNIFEEDFEIFNKSDSNIIIKILVECLNPELEDHDEYIYSIRKTTTYDYNEKYFVLIPPKSSMNSKIALKVPNLK